MSKEELIEQNKILNSELRKRSDILDQTSRDYNEMKNKYDEILKALSQQKINVSNSETLRFDSEDYGKNQTEIELQQWNQTWSRLVSMICQYVPFPHIEAKNDSDKQMILVDMVSKLCSLICSPKETEEYSRLKKKYKKSKRNLKLMREECQKLIEENQKQCIKNKVEEPEEQVAIGEKLDELGQLLKLQLKQEKELIKEGKKRKKPVKTHATSMKGKHNEISFSGDDIDLDFSISEKEPVKPVSPKKKSRLEICPNSQPTIKKIISKDPLRESYGTHVNQLVSVVNDLRKDYQKIKKVLSLDEDYSFSTISLIDDSVVKPK